MTRKRWAVVMAAAVVAVMLGGDLVPAQDLTGWIKPDGFMSPDLQAGQYSFQAGVPVVGNRSRSKDAGAFADPTDDYWTRQTEDEWQLHSRATYALTDRWVVLGSLTFSPGQKDTDSESRYGTDPAYVAHTRYDTDHNLWTTMVVAFKPSRLFEVFMSAAYSRSMITRLPRNEDCASTNNLGESYTFFVGFNTAR